MKISVIVPVYNTEKFLQKCLDSLINQSLKDIEIICINDGSTDNSKEILESYSKKDDRIKIINQNNSGLSAARNAGLKTAKGDFIGFVDSDDWVDTDFFEKLYNAAIETNSDISCATILRVKKFQAKIRVKYVKQKTYTSLKDKMELCNIPKCCYVWNKLYKSALIKEEFFEKGVYFEDVLWTPRILKKANSITTAPNTNYYYRANSNSIVKKYSAKKQLDSYNAKKFIINFFEENNLKLSKKEKNLTKSIIHFLNIPILKTKEYENFEKYYLFGFLPIFKRKIKAPIIKENTFIVWEPCSKSHSEVVPGYAKYLLDLGYHVSILVTPKRYKEGLFCRFNHPNITFNKLSQKEIKNYFKNNNINKLKGVLVTTVGKICDCVHYEQAYSAFYPNTNKKKLLFVEHEASFAADKGSWREDLITLRQLNYKGAKSVVVNPHYFGDVKITPKNKDITRFLTIGAIKPNKKNSEMLIEAFEEIYNKGYRNFKLVVVGKGNLKHLPKNLRNCVEIKGRLPFDKMYKEIEKADFMLTSYNEYDKEHIRYNTSGTSGNFQLIYGFLKPCIIIESFAPINGLNNENSILYKTDSDYPQALEKAINLTQAKYETMQQNLKTYQQDLYKKSLQNLKELINEQ